MPAKGRAHGRTGTPMGRVVNTRPPQVLDRPRRPEGRAGYHHPL